MSPQEQIDKIKSLAKSKGIKIKYICLQLGLSETYLANVRNGRDRMTPERLEIIARILETTPEYLKGETDNPEIPKKDAPLPIPMLGKDAQKLLDMYDEMGKESKEQLMLYATSLYYVDRANRSAQYSGALAAYEGGTQQHTVSKETAEEVLRLIDGMEKNT